jgi:hypothetical protein
VELRQGEEYSVRFDGAPFPRRSFTLCVVAGKKCNHTGANVAVSAVTGTHGAADGDGEKVEEHPSAGQKAHAQRGNRGAYRCGVLLGYVSATSSDC